MYFLGGRGEIHGRSERTGYSQIADALKSDNYEFDTLVLAQSNEIPADAHGARRGGTRTDSLEQEGAAAAGLPQQVGQAPRPGDPPEPQGVPPMPRLEGLLASGAPAQTSRWCGRERAHVGGQRAGAAPPYPPTRITTGSIS